MDNHVLRSVVPPRPAASRVAGAAANWLSGYGLLVLVAASFVSALGRQIIVLLAEPMQLSLGLSDTSLGVLQGVSITLLGGLAAVPLGWLADRYGRRLMLGVSLLLWTGAAAACGLAGDFSTLFVAAIGLGIGEVGLTPIVYGLIPDIVSERRRVLANGVYTLAVILASGVGMAFSGALVQGLDSVRQVLPHALQGWATWRLAFVAIALPGPILALAVWLIRVHAPHDRADTAQQDNTLALSAYLRAHGRSMARVFGGSGLLALGIAAGINWAPVVAARVFGATAAQVGQGVGLAYLLGTAAGALLGAVGVKLLRRRIGLATPVRVIAAGAALAAVASLLMLVIDSAAALYLLFGVQVAALIAGSVLMPTLLQDITPAPLRSRLIAIGTGVTVSLGALSPVLVGALSDLWHRHAPTQGGSDHGLLIAMAGVGAVALALAAVVLRSAEQPFVRTVAQINPGLVLREAR